MDLSKLTIPASIVIGCAILGAVYYATETNKQESIERQQRIELQEKEEARIKEEEKEQKEYVAERKDACLKIYQTEQDEWSNVAGWDYNQVDDVCYITYREQTPKTKAECLENWSLNGEEPNIIGDNSLFYGEYTLCMDGRFRNSF